MRNERESYRVGVNDERPGVRDAYQLRSFLMNALRHALAESHSPIVHGWALEYACTTNRGPLITALLQSKPEDAGQERQLLTLQVRVNDVEPTDG